MKKLSIILPHFETFRWTAVAVHAFKTYGFSIPWELIVCDNSPGHPSIQCLTETSLGEGIKIVSGEPSFGSHGKGYFHAYKHAAGDWIFTAESDSYPTRHGWGEEYIKASTDYDLIGPEMPMGGGTFIHPCGALVNRKVLDAHQEWRSDHRDWKFIPGAAPALGLSDKGYHVVASDKWLSDKTISPEVMSGMRLWEPDVGPWQSMISFDDDSFDSYWKRTGIKNWEPTEKGAHLRIGYEPGQHLSYFAESHGFRCLRAPTEIVWMDGMENRQAAYSRVFGGFEHAWCGTSSFSPAIAPNVRDYKMSQMNQLFSALPELVRAKIEFLEERYTK